jgi:hypothetical protein
VTLEVTFQGDWKVDERLQLEVDLRVAQTTTTSQDYLHIRKSVAGPVS